IALGFVAADPDYAGRLRAAQIGAIVRLTPLTMAASCLNAAILLATIESMGEVRPTVVVVMVLAAFCAGLLLRTQLARDEAPRGGTAGDAAGGASGGNPWRAVWRRVGRS